MTKNCIILAQTSMVLEGGLLTLILVAAVVGLAAYYWLTDKRSRYPPGPFTLPIIGNIHQVFLAGSMVKFLEKYRKQYGNVSVRLY